MHRRRPIPARRVADIERGHERFGKALVLDRATIDAYPLIDMLNVRRGISTDPPPGNAESGLDKRAYASLPFGACDVNASKPAVRISEASEQIDDWGQVDLHPEAVGALPTYQCVQAVERSLKPRRVCAWRIAGGVIQGAAPAARNAPAHDAAPLRSASRSQRRGQE
jgi:hypothetical protein